MSDFWQKLNEGKVSDEELFRHLLFFEKQAGMANAVELDELWAESEERKAIKNELLKRGLLNEKGPETLSAVLQEIGKKDFEVKMSKKERE